MAFAAFFRVLLSAAYASRVRALQQGDGQEGTDTTSAAEDPAQETASAARQASTSAEAATEAPTAVPAPASGSVAAGAALQELAPAAALQLLALFQREGRLLDFLFEDIGQFQDDEVGAAVRVIHAGCRRVLDDHVELGPIRPEEEGTQITLDAGFPAHEIRLTGNVVGQPPFRGTLNHAGWRARSVRLPQINPGHDVEVVAPAEVEL